MRSVTTGGMLICVLGLLYVLLLWHRCGRRIQGFECCLVPLDAVIGVVVSNIVFPSHGRRSINRRSGDRQPQADHSAARPHSQVLGFLQVSVELFPCRALASKLISERLLTKRCDKALPHDGNRTSERGAVCMLRGLK